MTGVPQVHRAHIAEAILERSVIGRVAIVDATGERGRVSGFRVNPGGDSFQVAFDHDKRVFWRSDLTILEERA